MTMTSKRVAIYSRSASRNANSIAHQDKTLKHHVSENGGHLIGTYRDDGQSGTRINRPALSAMLGDLKKKIINVVLVHSFDRLARGYDAFNRVLNKLTAAGVTLATTSAVYDTDGMEIRLMSAMSDDYSKQHSEAVKKGMPAAKKKRLH